MFWSDPILDLKITVFLLVMVLIITGLIFAVTKKIFASLLGMSILSNLIFYLNADSRLFDIYNLKWIVVFTLNIWPYINILLAIALVSFYSYEHYKAEKNN